MSDSLMQNMASPQYVEVIWKTSLKFSGRMKTNGSERNQKITKPVNSDVVVGISGPKVLGMLWYEGQRAVRQILNTVNSSF